MAATAATSLGIRAPPLPPPNRATWALLPAAVGDSRGHARWLPPRGPRGRLLAALRPLMAAARRQPEEEVVRTLLIDNYDSYTYNIYQELSVVNGVPPMVVRNDEWTWEYISYILYKERAFDNIVISPGPGSPTCPKDIGICLHVLCQCADIPILGVCLGHQALGFVHGAKIVHAPEAIHGRLSEIEHEGCSLFNHIPSGADSGFKVVRYHSLVIHVDTLPKDLIPIAWTTSLNTLSFLPSEPSDVVAGSFGGSSQKFHMRDPWYHNNNGRGLSNIDNVNDLDDAGKVLMGIKHSSRPHFGVQFHPESIATSYGRQIFQNFKKMTIDYGLRSSSLHERKAPCADEVPSFLPNDLLHSKQMNKYCLGSSRAGLLTCKAQGGRYLRLQWKKIDNLVDRVGGAENIFCELFSHKKAEDTFWLDSSSVDQNRAGFSFMGGKGGPLWKQVTFHLSDQSKETAGCGGYLTVRDAHGSVRKNFLKDGFLEFLNKELQSFQYDQKDYEGLPFDFCGGFVGFLGYGLKVECGASSNKFKSATPDACFFFADNLLVINHNNGDVYILSIHDAYRSDGGNGSSSKNSWLAETEKRLLRMSAVASRSLDIRKPFMRSSIANKRSFVVEKSKDQYIRDVKKCLDFIRDGESYELCLTTQMRRRADNMSALQLYLGLRKQNPAPYAAWLNFSSENLSICCSSPERFLRLDGNGVLEAKPIKGTIARGGTSEEDERLRLQLQYSEKDQAENLMIVDLLRNDLGRVCEPGSVHVPHLMEVQTYATVHTMVSTIRGTKKSNLSPIDCVRAAFPGGSMTGAPKLRSMELLDSLESCLRGVYSGSIGFFSYNHTFDLNIVIRTVVLHNGEASVGAGGAIVALSDPEGEYKEMMLKAKAPTKVVEECAHLDRSDSLPTTTCSI